MRAPLATLLAACLSIPGSTVTAPASALAAQPAQKSPEQLYDEGRKAYRLGKFKVSVERWEEAYALSDNPLLLYNIALAYKGLYTLTDDIADLRKARAVFDNFITLAEADPELDPDDAPERLAELDEMIAEAEENERTGAPPPVVTDQPEPPPPRPLGDDPGKKLRLAGAATMGGGGGLLVLGGALAAYFGVKGSEFRDDVQRLNAMEPSVCGNMPAPAPGEMDTRSADCRQLFADREAARDNGRASNLGLGLSLGIAGGLGVAAIVAGAVVFAQGNRRTRIWERGGSAREVRLVPGLGGLSVRGRF